MSNEELSTRFAVLEVKLEQIERDLGEIQTTMRWVNRIVITAFLAALSSIVINGV